MDTSAFHVEHDVGDLLVSNISELIPPKDRNEAWLSSLSLEGVKHILKEIWKLPKQYNENVCVVQLPKPTTVLPREKPIPKPKPPTKWETFAKKKGIVKKQKQRLIWDDTSKSWKPKFGYKSVKNTSKDWMVELPDNADPNEDPFAKQKQQKTENIAKNEYQRLRNIAQASKMKVVNMETLEKANKTELAKSLASAKTATASLGKFTKALPKEKTVNLKKRKFDINIPTSLKEEKDKYLSILDNMNKGKPKLDIPEAVQLHVQKKMKKSSSSDTSSKKKKGNKKRKNDFRQSKKGKKNKFKNKGKKTQ